MTGQEFEAILDTMSEEQFEEFRGWWGGGGSTRAWYVDDYLRNIQRHETRLCHRFRVPTEEEKRTQGLLLQQSAPVQQHIGSACVVAGHSINGPVTVNITALTVLEAMVKRIEGDKTLQPEEKRSILERLRGFMMHPYVTNLATSMIWDGVKWVAGS